MTSPENESFSLPASGGALCVKCREPVLPEERRLTTGQGDVLHQRCYDDIQRDVGANRWRMGITRKEQRRQKREAQKRRPCMTS